MSNLSDLLPAGASAKSITATDSGSGIAINTPVILETAGTVTEVGAVAAGGGTPVLVDTANSGSFGVVWDSSAEKVVIAYDGASLYGTAVVGTVSGTSISYGTPVVFNSANSNNICATFDSNSNKVVIAYRDNGNSYYGTGIVGTVSGTAISFGTAVVFESANTQKTSATFDSDANKVVIAYKDDASSIGQAVVGTVSGTAISFGTAVTFESANVAYTSCSFDSASNKVVISYTDEGNSDHGTAIVGTVSGTAISFGTAVVFEAAGSTGISSTFDTAANKVVISYTDVGNSSYGTAIVGTVSGTAISFGTAVVFETANTFYTSAVFDTTAGKVTISYQDIGNTGDGTVSAGTVSGTAISFDAAVVVSTGNVQYLNSVYDPTDNKVVMAYSDSASSDDGYSVVYGNASTNLTASNFLGFADEAISASASGVIVVQGGTKTAANTILPEVISFGSEAVYESATITYQDATFDSNSNKVVIAYTDNGNSNYGTAIVGTVSGTSISYGTPVVFESASTEYISATFDSDSNKVVVAYRDSANSDYGTAIVGTVSGTAISFGTAVVYNSGTTDYVSCTFDSDSNKVVIAYRDVGAGSPFPGTAIVGTVSGTAISYGTAVVFEAANSLHISTTFDSDANKVVISYQDNGNSNYGTGIVGTVSGTAISFGTAVVYEAASTEATSCGFDSNSNKVVIAYRDSPNSDRGTAIVGTVSGTSISYGTAVVFNSLGYTNYSSVTFDSNANKVVIAYQGGASPSGSASVGTVSGTAISFVTAVVFNSAHAPYTTSTFDSNSNKTVIAFQDDGNSSYGTGIVGTLGNDFTVGSNYYVQPDGSYDTSAGSPSVKAGLAISTTSLLLSGDS